MISDDLFQGMVVRVSTHVFVAPLLRGKSHEELKADSAIVQHLSASGLMWFANCMELSRNNESVG